MNDGDGQATSGRALSRAFWVDVVEPIVRAVLPQDAYSAGLLGPGSEVLGLDTPRSRDHDWGPRVQVFVAEEDDGSLRSRVEAALPAAYRGHSLDFGARAGGAPWVHVVDVLTVARLLDTWVGFVPPATSVTDWLAAPWQGLRSIVDGSVFHDGLGQLSRAQAQLEWYPTDMWRFVLASQWQRISQEMAFVGRTIELDDEPGSRVITARLVRDCMHLALLIERRYPMYSKWLGSVFMQLASARELAPILQAALDAGGGARQDLLADAYELLASRTNQLELCEAVDATRHPYFSRPYMVVPADRIAASLRAAIGDDTLRRLPLVGCVSQSTDSTDLPLHAGRAIYDHLWAAASNRPNAT